MKKIRISHTTHTLMEAWRMTDSWTPESFITHSNGDISFFIDSEVEARLDQLRFPGESDDALITRLMSPAQSVRTQ